MADKIAKSIKDLEKKNNDVLVFCKHTGDVFQTQLKEDKGTLYMSIENNNGKKDWVEYDANNFSKVDLFENYKNLSLYEYLEFGKGSEFVEGLVKQIYGVELKEVYNYSKYNDETYKVRANWENFAKEINDISTKITKEFDPDSKKSKAEYVQLYAAEIYDKLSSTEFFDVAQDIYVYKEVSEKGKSVEEAIKDFGVIKEGKESDEILANYAAESAAAKSKLNTLSIMIHNPEHFARPSGKDKDKRDGWFSFIYPLAIRILAVGPAAVGLCSYKDIKERYPIGKTTAEYAVIKAKFEEYKFMQNEVDKKDMTYEDAKMRNEEIKKEYAGIFAGLNKELDFLNKETDKAEKEKTNLTSEKEKLEEKLANEKEPKAIEKLNEQIKDKDEKIKNVDAKLENLKDKKQDLADKTKDTVEKYKLDSRNAIERNHKAKNEARVEYVKSKNEFEKVKKEFDKMESDKKKLDPNSKEFKELEVKLEAKGKELDVADKKLINAEISLKDVKAAKPSEYEINKIEKELNLDKPETNFENKVEENTKHEKNDMPKDSSSEKTQDVGGQQDKYIINKYENIYNFKSADKLGDIYTEKSFEFTMTNDEGKTEVITEKNLKTFDSEIIKDLAKYLNENKYAIHPKIEQTFNEAYKESCSRENIEYNPKERLFDDFYVFKIEEVLVETTDENNKDRIGKPTIYTARECYSRNFILEKTYNGKTETFTPKDIDKMSSHDINVLMTEVKNRDWKFSKKIEKRLDNALQQKREIENNIEKETEKIDDTGKTTDSVTENSVDKNIDIKETAEIKEKAEEKTIDKTEVSEKTVENTNENKSENSNEKPSEVTEKSKQDLTRGIESISKEKDEIKKNIDKLENKIDAKYSKIEKTKADLEKTSDPQQKQFLEKKIDNMRNDISNWKNEVATEKERLNKLENNLKSEMDNFEKANDKIEQSVEKRTENKSDIGSYIDKFLDKFGAVLGNDIKDSLIDLKNGFEELENKIDNLENSSEKQDNNIEVQTETNTENNHEEHQENQDVNEVSDENLEQNFEETEIIDINVEEAITDFEEPIDGNQATPEQIAEVEAQEQAARERAENQISEEDLAAYEAQEKARLEAEQQENENSVDPSSDVATDTTETIVDESSQDNVVGQEELIQEENQNVEVEQDAQDKVEDNSRQDATDKTIEKYDNSFKKTIESMQVVYKDIAVNFDKINTRKDLYDVGKVVDFALKVEDHNKDVQILEVAPDTLKLGENKENENHDINITRGDEGKFNTVGLEGSGYMFEVDKNIVDGRVKNFEGNLSEFIGNRIENAKITNVLEFNPDTEKFEKIDLDNLTDKDKEDIASALESLIEDKDKVSNILEHSDIFDKDEDKNKDKYEFDEEAETFDEDELLTDDMEIPNVLDNLDVDDMNLVDNEPFNVDIPDDNQLENNLDDYNNDYDYDYNDSEN